MFRMFEKTRLDPHYIFNLCVVLLICCVIFPHTTMYMFSLCAIVYFIPHLHASPSHLHYHITLLEINIYLGANWKTWRTRYFLLTEHVLYYLSSPKVSLLELTSCFYLTPTKNPAPRGAILLSNTIIEGADATIDKPWCFLVKARKSYTGTIEWTNRTYYLQVFPFTTSVSIHKLMCNRLRTIQT
jgi:hypothetical protein